MRTREVLVRSRFVLWLRRRLSFLWGGTPPDAITVGETIYYFDAEAMKDRSLRRHEYRHVLQGRRYKRLSRLRYWLAYWWETIMHGYEKNRFEVDARSVEDDPEAPTADAG